MKIIDISWPITEHTTQYKNRNEIKIVPTKEFDRDGVRSSCLTIGSHVGTHVDAPAHFLKEGVTIEKVSLEKLMGPCEVLDLTFVIGAITAKDLASFVFKKDIILLFKTRNSLLSFDAPYNPEFVYLDKTGAQFLADAQVRAVGTDYLGIERNQPQHETHDILLGAGIPIIEGLRLAMVQPGHYHFYCLPLAVHGAEAAPARAVLVA